MIVVVVSTKVFFLMPMTEVGMQALRVDTYTTLSKIYLDSQGHYTLSFFCHYTTQKLLFTSLQAASLIHSHYTKRAFLLNR